MDTLLAAREVPAVGGNTLVAVPRHSVAFAEEPAYFEPLVRAR